MEKSLALFKSAFSKLGEGIALSVRAVAVTAGDAVSVAGKKLYELVGKKVLKKIRPFTAVLMTVSGIIAVISGVLFVLGNKE